MRNHGAMEVPLSILLYQRCPWDLNGTVALKKRLAESKGFRYDRKVSALTCFSPPRVDFSVLPLLFLGLFAFQLDRMNIASALTGGFATDINISQATVNLGNQLMFMGIVIFEIPCNMALQRVRMTS